MEWSESLEKAKLFFDKIESKQDGKQEEGEEEEVNLEESEMLNWLEYQIGNMNSVLTAPPPPTGTTTTTNDDFEKKRNEFLRRMRNALRFGILCFSVGGRSSSSNSKKSSSIVRKRLQCAAVMEYQLHDTLTSFLLTTNSSSNSGDSEEEEEGRIWLDPKSILLAGKVLCNLVTDNEETAHKVLCDISPGSRWVDLILLSTKLTDHRHVMAALVAALHNSLLSLHPSAPSQMLMQTIFDAALINTLLRHMLPIPLLHQQQMDESSQMDHDNIQIDDTADETTQWISLLIRRLSSLGYFIHMYNFAAASSILATPEQLVLLHCIHQPLQQQPSSFSSTSVLAPINHKLIQTLSFLARQVQQSLDLSSTPFPQNDDAHFHGESHCRAEALILIIEIMASVLGMDDQDQHPNVKQISSIPILAQARTDLGQQQQQQQQQKQPSFFVQIMYYLGQIVDRWIEFNRHKKSRDIQMSKQDQRTITALVQLIGNLSYQCPPNQDLLRTTIIPVATTTTTKDEDNTTTTTTNTARTALHVLLSCTSLSYSCFTLREWTIVAIRNALDNNLENQHVVENLEAQNALNNPELSHMGIQIDLDSQGNVQVSSNK